MKKYLLLIPAGILLFGSKPAACQALPTATSGQLGIFGTINAAELGERLSPKYPLDKGVGVTAGGYVQTPGLFGLEIRGTIDKLTAQYPQYTALGGLRARVSQNRFSEFVFVGAGMSHARYDEYPNRKPTVASWGTAVDVTGGVDLSLHFAHLSWRIAEVSYKRISVDNGINSFDGSTGLIYRF